MQQGMPDPVRLGDGLDPESDQNNRLHMQLQTPLRLRRQGKYLNRFDPVFYLEALARRLEGLNCLFENGEPLGREKWEALRSCFQAHFADQAPSWRAELRWRDFARYSNRQKRKVPMGGLIGNVHFFQAPDWLGPWLRAAELVHVGKGSVMGLGKVRISRRDGD